MGDIPVEVECERAHQRPGRSAAPAIYDQRRRNPMIGRMVLFGASGDLTSRLLMPAIAQLAEAGLLPPGFTIVGSANTDWSTDDFRQHIADGLGTHASGVARPPAAPWSGCSASHSPTSPGQRTSAGDRRRLPAHPGSATE